jgi:hypothetical protein
MYFEFKETKELSSHATDKEFFIPDPDPAFQTLRGGGGGGGWGGGNNFLLSIQKLFNYVGRK